MTRPLTLLCLLGWYVAASGSSPQSTEIYGEWSEPMKVGAPVNTESNDTYAFLSRDELTMYFTSDRPGGLGLDDLWFTTRASLDDPWGDPRNMSALNSSALDSLAVLSSDEHVMFFHSTRPGGCGAGDIWMTRRHNRRSEEWGPPINLGCVVNTPATEIAPTAISSRMSPSRTRSVSCHQTRSCCRRLRGNCADRAERSPGRGI